MVGFLNFGSQNQNAPANANANDNANANANNNANSNNDPNQNQNSDNNNNQNNNQNNVDNNTSIWDNKQSSDDNQNQNQNANQNANQNIDPQEAFNKHIADLRLTDGIDLSTIQTDLQEGNVESLNKAFSDIAANTYKAAMTQMNKLVDGKVSAAVEQSINESGNMLNQNLAVREMNEKLPFTTNKDISPVANAALENLMSQGKSAGEAIDEVKKFFSQTAQMVSDSNPDSGSPGNNNFNRNNSVNQNNQNNSDDEAWLKTLSQ